ncbi:MAG: hemolysin family protein [Vicinamibacterales bacterium]
MITIVVIVSLVMLNALFVAAEFAVVAAPKTALERRAARGERLAEKFFRIMTVARDQDRFIATAQIGITLASLGLGMYGEHAVSAWLLPHFEWVGSERYITSHDVAAVVALAGLTFLHIVFGEMIPKTVALELPEHTALGVARPMIVARMVLLPLVATLHTAGAWVLRRLGIDRRAGGVDRYYTPEELGEVVDESARLGLLQPEAGQVLRELLEFGDLRAREVMVPRVRVVGIETGTGAADLQQLLGAHAHTRYLVHTGDLDHTVGAVHIKDLVRLVREGRDLVAGDARPVPVVPETAPLDVVLDTMRRHRTQLALVLDEFGGIAGLVTMEDLFEEIVGEIAEGVTSRRPSLYRDRAGVWHAAGTVRVDELGDALGRPLEHPDVDSVGGLVLALLGRMAQVGDEVQFEGLTLRVVATQGHGVRECEIHLTE